MLVRVFFLVCVIAVPVVAMMDKRGAPSVPAYDDSFEQDEYDDGDEELLEDEDAFQEQTPDFPAEELPPADEPIADDFSAFDEIIATAYDHTMREFDRLDAGR